MGGFRKGGGSCNSRFVLNPGVAMASEASISTKNSLGITDLLAKKTQLVNYCENSPFLEPPLPLRFPKLPPLPKSLRDPRGTPRKCTLLGLGECRVDLAWIFPFENRFIESTTSGLCHWEFLARNVKLASLGLLTCKYGHPIAAT